MAVRAHVVASRGTDRNGMLQAFSSLGSLDIEEAGGWTWFMASVWTTGAQDIDACIKRLTGPSMFFTTEDGARWYLRLYSGGREPFVTMHEFDYEGDDGGDEYGDWEDFEYDDGARGTVITVGGLPGLPKVEDAGLDIDDEYFAPYAELEEAVENDEADADEEAEDASALDILLETFEELGVPLPDELIDTLRSLPDSEVRATFRQQHAAIVCDALNDFGIPHERAEALAILTGKSLAQAEMETDWGSLPRLLVHLGLGPYFENFLQEILDEHENEMADEGGSESEETGATLKALAQRGKALPLTEIAGGPVPIAVEKSPGLYRAARYLDPHSDAAFVVECAAKVDTAAWTYPSYVDVFQDGLHVITGFNDTRALIRPKSSPKVAALLTNIPDGSALELVTVGEEDATQRYSGRISNGEWVLTHSHPEISAETLRSALALFQMIASDEPISARDESEADAIM